MKVFIVGATGYIGGTVAVDLVSRGFGVLGLARSAEKANALRRLGVEPIVGDFEDREVLFHGAQHTDATLNIGDSDRLEVAQALVEALAGSGKTLIHTSGSSIVVDDAEGQFAGETILADDAPYSPMAHRLPRIAVDNYVRCAGVTRGIRAAVICPTMVYGLGRGLRTESDQIPKIAAQSRRAQAGVYIARGENIWSNVFIDDLADLYRLALEKAPSGAFFFAENGEASLKSVAEAISRQLGFGGRTASWSLKDAEAEFGNAWPRVALATNCRVRATNARRLLGWVPHRPALKDARLVAGAA